MRPTDPAHGSSTCPKYDSCNAQIGPFDALRSERRMLPGESLCLWLRERSKPDGLALARGTLAAWQLEAIEDALSELRSAGGPVAKAIRRASRHGSKIGSGQALGDRGGLK